MSAILHPNYHSKAAELNNVMICSDCGKQVPKNETYVGGVCKQCHCGKNRGIYHMTENVQVELQNQIAALQKEVATLRKESAEKGKAAWANPEKKQRNRRFRSKIYDTALRKHIKKHHVKSLHKCLKEINPELKQSSMDNMVSRFLNHGTISRKL